MRIGTDYYPEHWDPSRWETDARMMQEAGISIIRIAEFGWSLLEPSEGQYDFSLFDSAIELFAKYGIRVVMGTPTAAPPKWLADAYPSILQEDTQRHPREAGSRRHYCFNSAIFREKAAAITRAMAVHYGKNPHVAAWQIDNEFGCHSTTLCYCDDCAAAFRRWLEEKYGNIDALNTAWGTVFWSQIYRSFDEIIPPRYSACDGTCPDTRGQNPSLLLDYRRFSSDAIVNFQRMQADILREYTKAPITHNFMGFFFDIDYYKLAADLDFVSLDNYPGSWGASYPTSCSFSNAMMRSYKKKPFWVMEQQSGPCGWGKMGANPEPGRLRLWTWQCIARGAETVVYFRWRAALFGTEQYWHGILNHDGAVNRRYDEIARTANEVNAFGKQFKELSFRPRTAIVQSFDSLWSHGIQPHAGGFSYVQMLLDAYDAMFYHGVTADFVEPSEDMSNYRVVFAPALNVVDQATHDRLAKFVREGGHLVLTYRSGTRTPDNTMYPLPIPGIFSDLVGAVASDFDPLEGRSVPVTGMFGDGTSKIWCDVMQPDTADTLALYAGQHYAGRPAVTVNEYGKGRVYYLACDMDTDAQRRFYAYVLDHAGLKTPFVCAYHDVEITQAEADGEPVWFLLNHSGGVRMLEFDGVMTDCLTGKTVKNRLSIPPLDVVILKR